jgi:hypothetical protein
MANLNIARLRLHNQHIAGAKFERPGDVVKWFGAVQAQDYLGALWAIGLRMRSATEGAIEQALADRTIVRTWPMRGTLHFVAPADARWMLKLLTPRIVARCAGQYRRMELDEAVFSRSRDVLTKALQGGKQLSRGAIYRALETAGIATANQRGLHILAWLAQAGVICFGARAGKQQTFALLDEWIPQAKTLERDEALAELAGRYFMSHGPASLQDFAWWSGLTVADARAGLAMVKSRLLQATVAGQSYWLASSPPVAKDRSPTAHLLPAYDEYTVAYQDRSAVLDPLYAEQAGNGIFSRTAVVDGQVVGVWKRVLKSNSVVITPSYFTKLDKAQARAVAAAANRYGEFLDTTVVLPC